jgi:hypothetical protein
MPLVKAEDLDTSPPEFLVEDTIPFTGTGFLWGESRWGKSLLVNGELALAIANGTEFFGRKTVQGSVAICLGEGLYDAGVRKQARLAREEGDRLDTAIQMSMNIGEERAKQWLDDQLPYTDDNLYYVTEPFVVPLDNGGVPTRSLRAAVDALKQVPDLALVILDSLSDFTPSLSISNDASANRVVQGMKVMARELDCVVLAIAHPTRNGDRMLGAGRLFNSADFVIKMEPDTGSTATGQARSATVSCEKNKYGRPFEPFGYTIEPCAWEEPVLDDDDLPTGETQLIRTATVRARDAAAATATPSQQPGKKPLPTLIKPEVTGKRKRTGLRTR